MSDHTEHILTFACPEKLGIVHSITEVLVQQRQEIIDLKQFGDRNSQRFFLRVHFACEGGSAVSTQALREAFAPLAEQYWAELTVEPKDRKRRVLLMVSKSEHCLNDLMFRARVGELPIEVVAVVSNHDDHRDLVEWHGIPYHHIPVTPATKPQAEAELLKLRERYDVELVVLARYMQVLSSRLVEDMAGEVINIHHSFLPSFKGARPYHQAYEKGVKTVGATAHYVNAELDEGPIIAQQVVEVDHTFDAADLAAAGRDTERKALANAVKSHCEGRVFLNGNRTVVLKQARRSAPGRAERPNQASMTTAVISGALR